MSPRRRNPDPWPWPGDTPVERARRIARSYRDALLAAEPDTCTALDARAARLGQGWITPKPLAYHDDDLLTAPEVATMCDVQPGTVDQWRKRGLPVTTTPDGPRFLVRDVLAYHAEKRRKRGVAT